MSTMRLLVLVIVSPTMSILLLLMLLAVRVATTLRAPHDAAESVGTDMQTDTLSL